MCVVLDGVVDARCCEMNVWIGMRCRIKRLHGLASLRRFAMEILSLNHNRDLVLAGYKFRWRRSWIRKANPQEEAVLQVWLI